MRLSLLLLIASTILAACSAAPTLAPSPTVLPSNTPPEPTASLSVPTLTPSAQDTAVPSASPTAKPNIAGNAAEFPDPANYTWAKVTGDIDMPTDITNAGDGSGRLFIVERDGFIRIVEEGKLVKTPFLSIESKVTNGGSEQGLLGLAFDPAYNQNGYFYVNYTDTSGDTVIARYKVSADDPNLADPNSETILLQQDQPFQNHNGGSVRFGPDGYLYLGLGDGGYQGDPYGNGQSTDTLLGKILRIDVKGGSPYTIPADNPFVNGGGKPEIWAYGLRNPWRIAFDSLTKDLYIADVGQSDWEEVDFIPAGSAGGMNFGWNVMEGSHLYAGGPTTGLVLPVAEYSHAEGGCSITGGEVYRGAAMPEWDGIYFYGDYCSGKIWGLLRTADGWKNQLLFESGFSITTFGLDETKEIYLASFRNGEIYQLTKK
jgi:glucose/arabinose dehydrogenase